MESVLNFYEQLFRAIPHKSMTMFAFGDRYNGVLVVGLDRWSIFMMSGAHLSKFDPRNVLGGFVGVRLILLYNRPFDIRYKSS